MPKGSTQTAQDKDKIISELIKVANFVSDGILVTDRNTRIIMCNRAHALRELFTLKELLGETLTTLVDEGFYKFLSPIDVTQMGEVLKVKKVLNFEAITKTGRRLLVTANPIMDVDGEIYRVVYTSRDITELDRVKRELQREASLRIFYEQQLLQGTEDRDFAFNSKEMRNILDIVLKVSQVDSPIFLSGESGVGKGMVARKIHSLSKRQKDPFVEVNCAAIPETLFESEIFGYEEGAFTGAKKQGKPGLMEMAGEGTLFLDEIGELAMSLQAKLLQVLQDGDFRRVGGTQAIKLKARIISATNGKVEEMIQANRFREDLYYRLCVVPIHVPALRERPQDILLLADLFLQRFNEKYEVNKDFVPEVKEWMHAYSWPGNVRELQNIVERLAIVAESDRIRLEDIPEPYRRKVQGYEGLEPSFSLKEASEESERKLLENIMSSGRSSREAARTLGISQTTLLRKAKKYGFSFTNNAELAE
ncbi:MAG: sigma-54 interaction domain-containing protein [Ignavibacteriales bacterium]